MTNTKAQRRLHGTKLSALIKAHGKTQKQLAEFLGYTPNTVSERTQGRVAWDMDEIVEIAKFLSIKPQEVTLFIFA